MIKLDDNLLLELGLGALPPEEKKKMLAHIYETLEMRVGMELAKQMTDAQLNEFEQFITRNDEAGALQWLETNFPNYKNVVAAEFEKLKQEVKQVAPQILAGAQAQAQGMPPQGQPDPYAQSQPYAAPAGQPYPPAGYPGQPMQQPQYPGQPMPAQPQSQPPYPGTVPGQPQYQQPYPSQPPAPQAPGQQPYPGQPAAPGNF